MAKSSSLSLTLCIKWWFTALVTRVVQNLVLKIAPLDATNSSTVKLEAHFFRAACSLHSCSNEVGFTYTYEYVQSIPESRAHEKFYTIHRCAGTKSSPSYMGWTMDPNFFHFSVTPAVEGRPQRNMHGRKTSDKNCIYNLSYRLNCRLPDDIRRNFFSPYFPFHLQVCVDERAWNAILFTSYTLLFL